MELAFAMGKTDFLPVKMKDFLYEFAKRDFIYMGGARNKNKNTQNYPCIMEEFMIIF